MHYCLLQRYGTCCINLRIHHTSRIPYRAQQIDGKWALQTAEKENTDRISFTLTFRLHNHAVKSVILKNFQ